MVPCTAPLLALALATGQPPGPPPPLWPQGPVQGPVEPEKPDTPEYRAWETKQRFLHKRMVGFGATMAVGMTVLFAGIPLFVVGDDACSDGRCGAQYTGISFMAAGGAATLVGLVGLSVYATRVKRNARLDPTRISVSPGGLTLRF